MHLDPIETEETDSATATPSLREALDASYDAAAEEEGVGEPAPPADAKAGPAEAREGETQEEANQRARDDAGRFAKEKKAAKPAVKPVVTAKPVVKPGAVAKPGAQPIVPTSAQQAEPQMKPPQSFRGPAKEAWGQTPEPVRVEILRREKEFGTALAGFAEDRKYSSSMRQAFAPFEAQIRAEGSTPDQTITNLMSTALLFRTGAPHMKAQAVAQIINDFGVPLEGLVAALSGQQPPPGQQAQRQAPQHVDPAAIAAQVEKQLMERLGTQRDAGLVARAEQDIASGLDGKAMHGLDGTDYSDAIRQDMADIIERAAARGLPLTLEEAYGRAAREHPEVSKVLERQKASAAATKKNQSTQQVRAAASSVRSNPATTPVSSRGQGRSLREELESAVESLES